MATLTIGILTMNEERRIAACIDSAAFADQIIVVDHGRMVGIGTHDALLETSETYREIVDSQLSAEAAA